MSNTGNRLTLSGLWLVKSWNCPSCKAENQSMQFTGGDTVEIGYARPEHHVFDCTFLGGTCKSCKEPLYILEISRLCHAPEGYLLCNDHCFSEEQKRTWRVSGSEFDWMVTRHYGVKGVFFQASDESRTPQSFTSQETFDWLDIHTIGPDAFSQETYFYERAQKLYFQLRTRIGELAIPEGV